MITQPSERARFLIEQRGYECWDGQVNPVLVKDYDQGMRSMISFPYTHVRNYNVFKWTPKGRHWVSTQIIDWR